MAILPASALALVLCLSGFVASVQAKDKPLSSVADLRYGVVLYEYYQRHYHSALTELAIAEERGGIQGHGDHPQLIEGGIKLIYGMEKSASDIFSALLAENHSLESRNTAWFYLAKLQYHRGEYVRALRSLQALELAKKDPLIPQAQSLRASIAIRLGDTATADSLIDDFDDESLPRFYSNYNLGAAFARDGQCDQAIPYFQSVYNIEDSSPMRRNKEFLALYDKSLTNAGYCLILLEKPDQAIDLFSRIRLKKGFDHQALLGLGWANAETNQFQAALQPWLYLQQQDSLNQYVLEAMLAVPYAYEAMSENGLALAAYRNAEDTYNREIEVINATLPEIQLLDIPSVISASGRESAYQGWLDQTHDSEGSDIPDAYRLIPESQRSLLLDLLVQNQFQELVQSMISLDQMEEELSEWAQTVSLFDDLLQARSAVRKSQVAQIEERQFSSVGESLQAVYSDMKQELERVDSESLFFEVADSELIEQLQRLEGAEENYHFISKLEMGDDDQRQRLARYRGVLLWDASESYADNLWEHQKQLKQLEAMLQEYQENQHRLEQAVLNAPDVLPFESRIASSKKQIDEQLQSVVRLKSTVEKVLKRQLSESLVEQKSKLGVYRAEARLAQARLYDQQRQGIEQ